MMDDLIKRQEAIDALDKEYRCTDQTDDWDGLKTAMLIIENLPSAEPEITDEQAIEYLQSSGWMQRHDKQMYEMGAKEQPERTGKWLPEYGDANARAYYCSACNFYYTTFPEEMNYCPYCGAKMEKMPPLKVKSSKQTVIEKWQKMFERRHTYCRDCERSIYGKYADCDINIENKGLYVSGDCECRCKVKKEQEKTDESD